ncbi:MAG: PEP-CTERM sorting domain-containing protein [Caulobacteraceae bacterium]|nr:PEP-CTERM sorting domain-containing protein [Caulobacteraceae bacterium]
MNTKTILGAAIAALSFGALATAANAVTYVIVPGSGYDSVATGKTGKGNSGTDAFGNTWQWNKTVDAKGSISPGKGYSAWGTPGLGNGDATYEGSAPADAFFISFVVDHTGATFNKTASPFANGYNEFTRFSVCTTTCVAWTPMFLSNSNEVDFYAPAGDELKDGEKYFVNVVFNQKTLSGKNIGFSADFATAVPEPGSWALMILGAGAVGAAMRGRRRLAVA